MLLTVTVGERTALRVRCRAGDTEMRPGEALTVGVPADALWPVPETDWYVATTSRSIPTARWIGARATTICIVEQLGFAIRPRCLSRACGLTSATTSGIPRPVWRPLN